MTASPGGAEANFPFNCWYVVAAADEIGESLTARRVLGRPVVLYRQAHGAVAALDDRCAHRAVPLSRGTIVDDCVVCPYHGFTYDASGTCVDVPSQAHVPYGTRVRSYPVVEVAGWLWIWLGEPTLSGNAEPPDVPALTAPGWTVQGGALDIAANYLLLHDNALDRTHFPFVHPHRSHRGYVEGPPPLEVEVTETTVSYSRTFAPAPLAEWQQQATGLPGGGSYVQRETGTFVSPALHIDEMDIIGPDGTVFRSQFVRAFTPVDAANTRILWWAARNYALDDAAVTERLREVHEGTMLEDQPLLEAIQAATPGVGGPDVHAAADAATIRVYQIVEAMLAEERPRPFSTRRGRARG